jgi:hypothetical protein
MSAQSKSGGADGMQKSG